jgi:NAD+ kinase
VTNKSPRVEDGTVKAGLTLHDEELGSIEGDMCASSTGVVRVQSRKKAEMFLVRTDGFSCTREKVTESSLAFTHPSTQQQMLMWKSTPKNVLLLKKLGDELLEEAKMVMIIFFSFLKKSSWNY